ncbi:MAG: glycosyltransferase [Bacteroidetes bacterium]|nr:glycosyltransferase [Bacteroidota bacterium]
MRRVAYISADPGVPAFGVKGCSVHVQEGLRALRAHGMDVTLFSARLGGEPPDDLANLPIISLPCPSGATSAERERAALDANGILREQIEQQGPFDLIYERYSLWSFAAMEYAGEHGVASVLEVNAPLIDEQAKHRTLVNPDEARSASRRAFDAAEVLLAVSNGVADWLNGFSEAQGRIHVVSNGVDTMRFRPELDPVWHAPTNAFVIGFVGSLKPWHGLSVLVKAFAQVHRAVPETCLLIVGAGPEQAHIEADLDRLGIRAAAHLTGAVTPAEVPRWLASMDVAVAPYADPTATYFSPLKVFEYMASGLPIVAGRIGQVSEILTHDVTGLLVEPGDVDAVAEALLRLYAAPPLRARLGVAARSAARAHHSWNTVFGRVLALAGCDKASARRSTEALA